jgi:hypothetical protein
MPRQVGQFVENNFTKGLFTEASGLSFPENACTETYNCVFKRTGEVTRRLGFEYESSYSLFTLTAARAKSSVNTFLWAGAGADPDSSFMVTQVGQYIYFYAVGDTLSTGKHATAIDLNSYDVATSVNPFKYPCKFAEGDGHLYVVSRYIEPIRITYVSGTDAITAEAINIRTRDIEGDPGDTYDVDERPGVSIDACVIEHLYNLWNQGWGNDVKNVSAAVVNPISQWISIRSSELPSNADRWWIFKDTTDEFDPTTAEHFTFGSGEAPKGHFIYDAFNYNRNSAVNSHGITMDTEYSLTGETQALGDLTDVSTIERPTCVAFFANRAWYSGVQADGYNSKIYFSQLLITDDNAGQCYQKQDPTDETFSDLLSTDGGVIVVPSMGIAYNMMEASNGLVVWASNGIWLIAGSEGIGFSATDYHVQQISTTANTPNASYVNLNGIPGWINQEGIWILQRDETLGSNNVTSASRDSIQSFFDDIPTESIPYIKGTYNQKDRKVYWLYRSVAASTVDEQYEYDRCLVFNTITGSFAPWKLNTDNDIRVLSVATSTGFAEVVSTVNVVDSGDTNVTDTGATVVTTESTASVAVAGTTKFLTENTSDQVTWAEAWDTDYLDWTVAKGIGKNFSSYFITGYKARGTGLKKGKSNYVRIHSAVETNSSVDVQGVWDYYTSDGARWSSVQEGYKASTGQTYSERRLKIRGNGLSLQLRFASNEGKPFTVIGWATEDSVNTKP